RLHSNKTRLAEERSRAACQRSGAIPARAIRFAGSALSRASRGVAVPARVRASASSCRASRVSVTVAISQPLKFRPQLLDQLGQGQRVIADQMLAQPGPRLVVAGLGVLHGLAGDCPPVLQWHGADQGAQVLALDGAAGTPRAPRVAGRESPAR